MPSRGIIQPNGLYARFSTIVDDFTHYNCTEEALWEVFRDECGVNCAYEKIQRAKDDPERFEEAIEEVNHAYGEGKAKLRRNLMTVTP